MLVFGSGRGGRCGVRGFGFGITNPVGTEGVCIVCLCLGLGGVGGLVDFGQVLGRVGWCYVSVCCEYGLFV